MQDYIQEWERLTVLCDINEREDLRVGKFIAGLREDIRRKLALTPNLTVLSAGSLALEVERNILRKKNSSYPSLNKTARTYTPRNPTTVTAPKRDTPSINQRNTAVKPNVHPKEVVYFKCNGHGNFRKDCPNARAFTLQEWEEIKQDTRPRVILVTKNGKEEEVCLPLNRRTLMGHMQWVVMEC